MIQLFFKLYLVSIVWLLLYYSHKNGYLGKYKIFERFLSEFSGIFKFFFLPLLISTDFYVLIATKFIISFTLILYINRTVSIRWSIMLILGAFMCKTGFDLCRSCFSPIELALDTPNFSRRMPVDCARQSVVNAANQAIQNVRERDPLEIAGLVESTISKMGRGYTPQLRGGTSATVNNQSQFSFEEWAAVKIVSEIHPLVGANSHKYGAWTSPGPPSTTGRNSIQIYCSLTYSTKFATALRDNFQNFKDQHGI